MPLSKIQAESMNLADTYAFTGTVSGAGALTLVTDTTISSGATSVVFGPLTTYDVYVVELIDLNHSTSGGAILQARYGTDASTFNSSSNYSYALESIVYTDSQATKAHNSQNMFHMTWNSAGQWGGDDWTNSLEGQVHLYGKQRSTTNAYPSMKWHIRSTHPSANAAVHASGAGYLLVNGTFTHIQFSLSTGTFTRGKMKLYGLT